MIIELMERENETNAISIHQDNGDITVISNQDQQNQRTELILEIRNLKASNAANYKCTAQNNGGNVHKTGKITVRCEYIIFISH